MKRRRKELGLLAGRYAAKELTARIAFKDMIHLPRPFVSDVMHAFAPEGFEQREPGAKCICESRRPLLGFTNAGRAMVTTNSIPSVFRFGHS